MKEISVLGVDLAKHVFQLHGVNSSGQVILRRSVPRRKLMEVMAQLPVCEIVMEACGGSSFWARQFQAQGHRVKLIAPQFVRPFVKSNKNDAADAEAIVEAASRPTMRFVAAKELWQQEIQTLHRVRELLVKNRTGLINSLHGLLMEFGVFLPTTPGRFRKEVRAALDGASEAVPALAKLALLELLDQLAQVEERHSRITQRLERLAEEHPVCKRIQTIPGVGPLTATACVAAIGDPRLYKSGRHFAASVGLVPRQFSSGGKSVLLGISKRGDGYLRRLLIHGSRAVTSYAIRKQKSDRLSRWVASKEKSRGMNRATVALANKNARMVWALMSSGQSYRFHPAEAV